MKNTINLFLMILISATSLLANDRQFLREKTLQLLNTYCPDGARIVQMALKNVPEDGDQDFTSMIDGDDEQACLTSINTIVHEENHGLNAFMGRVVLKEKSGQFSDEFYDYDYFYLKDGQFTLVRKIPTFPSREMVPTFPEHLKTFRFDTYIDTENAIQSTQVDGFFGLLDEFNSYYQGTRAAYNLLGYYENKGTAANWHDFFIGVNATHYGCLEFRLYLLKYLQFARERHPDIYRNIIENKDLMHTFLAIDQNVSEFFQSYFNKKPAIFERLRGYGWKISENANMLYINSSGRNVGHSNFMDVYNLLTDEMKKDEYQSLLALMRQNAQNWDAESVYPDVRPGDNPGDVADQPAEPNDVPDDAAKKCCPVPANTIPFTNLLKLRDPAGDVSFQFVDLFEVSVEKNDNTLVVRMRLANLPAQLTFNQRGVADNELEYEWAAFFDLDGDGTDDYGLELMNFKAPAARTTRGNIIENTQLSLWELSQNNASTVDVPVQGQQRGNELIIEVPSCSFVSGIQENTKIHFRTYYTDGDSTAGDGVPD